MTVTLSAMAVAKLVKASWGCDSSPEQGVAQAQAQAQAQALPDTGAGDTGAGEGEGEGGPRLSEMTQKCLSGSHDRSWSNTLNAERKVLQSFFLCVLLHRVHRTILKRDNATLQFLEGATTNDKHVLGQ